MAHAPQITKLAKQAAHRIVAAMRPEGGEFDGVTFQVEPFREFYRDAEPLFREHLDADGAIAGRPCTEEPAVASGAG